MQLPRFANSFMVSQTLLTRVFFVGVVFNVFGLQAYGQKSPSESAHAEKAATKTTFRFDDPTPHRYKLSARASKIDSRTREYPKIDFVFNKDGKVKDLQHAVVDTSIKPRGKLVIWLMSHNSHLFNRLADYGLHAVQVHYVNRWFSKICREQPVGETCRGNVRIEAATGEDFSEHVAIAKPDGMKERARQFVKWLAKENPQGNWAFFLTKNGDDLRWDDVIMAGSSHGSTTSARFAKHQKIHEASEVEMRMGSKVQDSQRWT